MKLISTSVLTALTLVTAVGGVGGCKSNESTKEQAQTAPFAVAETAQVAVTARVKAVDYTTRCVTLETPGGRTLNLIAGDAVKRLNEVKPGDMVDALYDVTLIAELRPPTADESASPIMYAAVAERAGKNQAPGAGVAQGVKVVTTVASVDVPNMLVTLRGPAGDTFTVRGRSAENLKKLKVGDTIVITYIESLAVGLEKSGS